MLIPCNIRVVTTAADMRQLYAIYTVRDISNVVQYIGVSPLSELFTLSDANCNSEFIELFGKQATTVDIEVEALTSSEREAYIEQRRLIAIHRPHCNTRGIYVAVTRQRVMCNETGETWPTASAAAKDHGLSQSALHHHLNRRPGHKTVKGRTYSRTAKS